MNIAVDLDDVVCDFWAGICRSLNLEYGLNLHPARTTDWNDNDVKNLEVFGTNRDNCAIHGGASSGGELDACQCSLRTWWDWLRDRDWVWATFAPVPGAIGALSQLRQQGHVLTCVTKKPEWAEYAVWKWLGRWRPPFNAVTLVPTGASKARATDAALLIDDNLDNIEEWERSFRPAITFAQSWNKDALCRAANWDEVLRLVEAIARPRKVIV